MTRNSAPLPDNWRCRNIVERCWVVLSGAGASKDDLEEELPILENSLAGDNSQGNPVRGPSKSESQWVPDCQSLLVYKMLDMLLSVAGSFSNIFHLNHSDFTPITGSWWDVIACSANEHLYQLPLPMKTCPSHDKWFRPVGHVTLTKRGNSLHIEARPGFIFNLGSYNACKFKWCAHVVQVCFEYSWWREFEAVG